MIRILLVDDHRVIRAGLAMLLGMEPDMEVVGEAADGDAAIALCRQLQPDIVVMDLKMPGRTGAEATAAIRAAAPSAQVLVFSSLIGDEDVNRAMQAGASGYLTKDATDAELNYAVRELHAGRTVMPAIVKAALERGRAAEPLTAREQEILKLVARGRSNAEIGELVGLTEHTVKGYMKSILSKLSAPDRAAAVAIAMQRGWISAH